MQCGFIKEDGEQCNALALTNSDYCFFHDEGMRKNLLESTSKGGKTPKKVFKPLPVLKINDAKSVVELLTTVINEVRGGDLDVRIANCLGFLSGHLLKAIELSDIALKLAIVEKTFLERKSLTKKR